MFIMGWWNLYKCTNCGTEFAISIQTDQENDTCCPKCLCKNVNFLNEDLIVRK